MLAPEVPTLSETPCTGCQQPFAANPAPGEVVWDPWHRGDSRWAALPYHLACAGEVLPPEPAPEAMTVCGRCQKALTDPGAALATLRARMNAARDATPSPEVVWRVVQRNPRAYQPEHFACLLEAVKRKRKPKQD